MNVRRGDVVLVSFPFASATGTKIRPALVVQSDQNNTRLANTIVVQITTNTRRAGESTQVLVDPTTTDGRATGLLSTSAVACENIATVQRAKLIRGIGRFSTALVEHALMASLGLP